MFSFRPLTRHCWAPNPALIPASGIFSVKEHALLRVKPSIQRIGGAANLPFSGLVVPPPAAPPLRSHRICCKTFLPVSGQRPEDEGRRPNVVPRCRRRRTATTLPQEAGTGRRPRSFIALKGVLLLLVGYCRHYAMRNVVLLSITR